MLNIIYRQLEKFYKNYFHHKYQIGKYKITLPPRHKLDLYQHLYHNYDKKLPLISKRIKEKYAEMTIIDVGANIGDTAVALRNIIDSPIICVEGNKEMMNFCLIYI